MFGRDLQLFRMAGIEVRINPSWLIVALVVAWALANDYFPEIYSDWSSATYWLTAVIGVMGFACSLIIHEFAHSLVARAHGIELRSITLFIFGGAAQIESEPASPKVEFQMAAAGPAASLALAAFFGGFQQVGLSAGWPQPIVALTQYLGLLNLVLALFNLAPAFPLDGGRILRSLLWAWWNDQRTATRWASRAGAGFGIALMTSGVGFLLIGAVSTGLWWLLMGLFIRGMAQSSIMELDIRRVAADLPVGALVAPGSAPVDPSTTAAALIDQRMLKMHVNTVPVVDGDRLVGLVSVADVRDVAADMRNQTPVGKLAHPSPAETQVDTGMNAADALTIMRKTGAENLVVRQAGFVVGVLSLDELLQSIALRLELETPDVPPAARRRRSAAAASLGA